LAGVAIAKMDINVFTQIGFVVLIGLASKNAILIVEFAKIKRDEGKPAREAVLEACELRLRPILMTSFAFILGVLPLVVAQGAGFEMRRALGTAVFSGMLGVTLFGIFLTPVFYYVIDKLSGFWLFSSRLAQGAGRMATDALRLKFLWSPAKKAWAKMTAPRKLKTPPSRPVQVPSVVPDEPIIVAPSPRRHTNGDVPHTKRPEREASAPK
jgi:multidrug efflux pump